MTWLLLDSFSSICGASTGQLIQTSFGPFGDVPEWSMIKIFMCDGYMSFDPAGVENCLFDAILITVLSVLVIARESSYTVEKR